MKQDSAAETRRVITGSVSNKHADQQSPLATIQNNNNKGTRSLYKSKVPIVHSSMRSEAKGRRLPTVEIIPKTRKRI